LQQFKNLKAATQTQKKSSISLSQLDGPMHAVPQTPEFVQEAAKKCSTSLNRLDELKGVQRGVPVAPEGRFCANTQTTHSCYVYIVSVTCSNIDK